MANARLEGLVVISSTTTVGTFAGSSVSVVAGSYFLYDFIAHFKSRLDSATGRTWTLTLDAESDTSTGKLTMAVSGGATTGTWTSGTIEDLLGFTTNLSSGNSWTGTYHCKYLWLPNCNCSSTMAPVASNGAIESDYTSVVSASGRTFSIGYSSRYVDRLEFNTVKGSKTWTALESSLNESFETFFGNSILYGRPVRLYRDRSNSGSYRSVAFVTGDFKPQPVLAQWTDSTESLWSFGYDTRRYYD